MNAVVSTTMILLAAPAELPVGDYRVTGRG